MGESGLNVAGNHQGEFEVSKPINHLMNVHLETYTKYRNYESLTPPPPFRACTRTHARTHTLPKPTARMGADSETDP